MIYFPLKKRANFSGRDMFNKLPLYHSKKVIIV